MIQLDDMLTAEDAAPWLKISVRELRAKSKGHRPAIPVFKINSRVHRYHPRTIIAKFQRDAGMPESLIAAALNPTPAQVAKSRKVFA